MSLLNAFLGRLVDGLLSPFEAMPPAAGLAVVSFLTASGMLAVIHVTSDHRRLTAARRALRACVFEIRLYNDDLRAMLRALGEMTRHNLTYLRLSMVPALWLAVPLGLLVAQLQFHYGYGGLDVGQQALVNVRVGAPLATTPELAAPPGIRIETPAAWIPSRHEAAWRIAAERAGDYELIVRVGEQAFTKTVRVSSAVVRRSPRRTDGRFVNQLLYPAEPPLPDGARVESIAVTYPRREITVLGRQLHWLVVYFLLSVGFALVLRLAFSATPFSGPRSS